MDAQTPDVVKMVKDCIKEADAQQSDWRDESRTSYAMVAGEQWDPADKKELEDNGRPAVSFNRMGTIIDAVSGSEVNNRQEVKYIPREIGDVAENEVLTAAAKWVRDNCDAEDEESDCFVDVLTCGMGWTETRMDYEQDPEGMCVIERVDPLQMRWDTAAKKRNLADRRWQNREKRFSEDELRSRWPEKADEVINSANTTGQLEDESQRAHNDVNPDQYASGQSPGRGQTQGYPVIHHQWYETECEYKVLADGQIVALKEDRFEAIRPMIEAQGLQYVKTHKRIYKQAFISGGIELESGLAPCQHDFTFQPITGRRDRNKGTWYGLARPMIDPQKWANKFFSQMMHIINTNAKGGVMVEAGAAANTRKFEESWAKADAVTYLNAGGTAKVNPKPQAAYPQAIGDMMNFAISSIRDTSGVSLELLGMADRDQNNYIESARTKAGLTILAGFFDALRLYRKKQGRVLAYYIQEYLSDGRLIRITGKDLEAYVPLVKQPGNILYDVIVDSAPTARDMKERTFLTLQQLAPMIQQSGMPIPKDLIDYMPLPTGLIDSWKQEMQEASQRPTPQQQQLQYEQQLSQIRIQEEQAKQKAIADGKVYVEAQSPQGTNAEIPKAMIKAQADIAKNRDTQAAQAQSRALEIQAELKAAMVQAHTKFLQDMELTLVKVAGQLLASDAKAEQAALQAKQNEVAGVAQRLQ